MNAATNLRETIIPKSNQINADDLIAGPRTVRITGVTRGDSPDQPVSINYEGGEGRPYKPCKSMRRVLIHAWGDDGREWVGRRMTLYCDPEVKFGGVKVGGIRISHLSNIDRRLDIALTQTRGKRAPYAVEPLPAAPAQEYPQDEFDKNLPAWRTAVEDGILMPAQIIEKAKKRGTMTDEQRKAVMAIAWASAQKQNPNDKEEF